MAYGLSSRARIEDAPAKGFAEVRSPLRSWRRLSESCRLELIEQALLAANDRIDGYPLAL